MKLSIAVSGIWLVVFLAWSSCASAQTSDPFQNLESARSAVDFKVTALRAGQSTHALVKSAQFKVFSIETTKEDVQKTLVVELSYEFKKDLIQTAVAVGDSNTPLRTILDASKVRRTFIPLIQGATKYFIYVYGSNVNAINGVKFSITVSLLDVPKVVPGIGTVRPKVVRSEFKDSTQLWLKGVDPTELQSSVHVQSFVVSIAKPDDAVSKLCFRVRPLRSRWSMAPTQTFLTQIGSIDENRYLTDRNSYREGDMCTCTSGTDLIKSSVPITVASFAPGRFFVQAFANVDYCPSIRQNWNRGKKSVKKSSD